MDGMRHRRHGESRRNSYSPDLRSPRQRPTLLHEVLDRWFVEQVRPRLRGRAYLTRFADDFVLTFEREEDALRVQTVLPKRFARYGLRLHPEKTRLVKFHPPSALPPEGGGSQRQRSFDLLGFTLYWGRSRKGRWVVQQKTMKSRFCRTLLRISMWCRTNRHVPVKEQSKALSRKLQGHYSYYGVTGNGRALQRMYERVKRIWHKWLGRRSNRPLHWGRMVAILRAFPLARPRIVHSVYLRVANP
jgi:RNA-directed DNA polymerase